MHEFYELYVLVYYFFVLIHMVVRKLENRRRYAILIFLLPFGSFLVYVFNLDNYLIIINFLLFISHVLTM